MSHWYSVCPQCKTAAINGLSGMVPPTQPAELVEIYHENPTAVLKPNETYQLRSRKT